MPKLAQEEGLSNDECNALKDWSVAGVFDGPERAVLGYVDAIVQDIIVPDEIFAPLRNYFSNRQIVELTLMIGAYISHARVLQALEVDLEPA